MNNISQPKLQKMILVEKEPFVYNIKNYRLSMNRVVESKEYGYICAVTDASELINAAKYINSKISKYPRIVKDIINCDSENPLYGEIPEEVKWVVLNMRDQFASFKINHRYFTIQTYSLDHISLH